ncbi:ADP-ribosylation factor-like protein 6-interacting protein 4 [Engraulis encrasicolus]|uniref:ADP-ribosylation factor-like protein 6-interacting protein 4 n=1 Tax=Engraulis encrasicolus TaxID=184585 RepID=UPI002FD6FE0B
MVSCRMLCPAILCAVLQTRVEVNPKWAQSHHRRVKEALKLKATAMEGAAATATSAAAAQQARPSDSSTSSSSTSSSSDSEPERKRKKRNKRDRKKREKKKRKDKHRQTEGENLRTLAPYCGARLQYHRGRASATWRRKKIDLWHFRDKKRAEVSHPVAGEEKRTGESYPNCGQACASRSHPDQ